MTALLALWLLASAPAEAGVRRFALAVGNNQGSPGMEALFFAEDDALKMQDVLVSVGGYQREDVDVVLAGDRNELLSALVGVRGEVALARQRGDETLFLFYYSGHADENRLQLGRTWVTYAELEELIDRTGADVRLAFLDACRSGAMTRSKGGVRAPSFVFDVNERLGASGSVVITSSSRDEASQESDEIGGSYFTHFLTSALVGAADENGDERITLGEAYQYVYHETVFRTSATRGGTQHPTYEWDLAGKGDVVLADLSAARSTLVFPENLEGTFAIFDRNRRMFVAEVELAGRPRDLSLRPGSYLLQKRYPSHLEVAQVDLADGARVVVDPFSFAIMAYEDDQAKGAIQERVEKALMPRMAVRIVAGERRFPDEEVSDSYLPPTPFSGLSLRFARRDGWWWSADVLSGGRTVSLVFDDLDYSVPALVTSTTAGGAFGFATRPDHNFLVGGGIRGAGAYFRRDFQAGTMDSQALFTLSAGPCGWLGWHPGRLEVDLQLNLQYLPYRFDDRTGGVVFSEGFLAFGFRF